MVLYIIMVDVWVYCCMLLMRLVTVDVVYSKSVHTYSQFIRMILLPALYSSPSLGIIVQCDTAHIHV